MNTGKYTRSLLLTVRCHGVVLWSQGKCLGFSSCSGCRKTSPAFQPRLSVTCRSYTVCPSHPIGKCVGVHFVLRCDRFWVFWFRPAPQSLHTLYHRLMEVLDTIYTRESFPSVWLFVWHRVSYHRSRHKIYYFSIRYLFLGIRVH